MKRTSEAVLCLAITFSIMFFGSYAFSQEEEEPIQMRPAEGTFLKTRIIKMDVMDDDKYQKWTELQNQAKSFAPTFNFDPEWKSNLPYLYDYLKRTDKIFIQLKDSEKSILSNRTQASTFADQLKGYAMVIKSYESKVESIRDKRQTSQSNLQTMNQKQTQLLNTLSQILKMMKATADSIIQNIK